MYPEYIILSRGGVMSSIILIIFGIGMYDGDYNEVRREGA